MHPNIQIPKINIMCNFTTLMGLDITIRKYNLHTHTQILENYEEFQPTVSYTDEEMVSDIKSAKQLTVYTDYRIM